MQPSFTKYRSINSNKKSRFILLSHLPIMLIVNSIYVFSGIAVFAFYFNADPISKSRVENKNQIAILWIIESLDMYLPSVAGFCLSAFFSYGVQVYSIGIWSVSNSFLNELMSEIIKNRTNLVKYLTCCLFGALSIGFSILFKYAKNSILSLFFVFSNSLNSPILGLFLLSILNQKANHVGAILAFVVNVGINLWLALSALAFSNLKNQEFNPNLYETLKNNTTFATTVTSNYYPEENSTLFYLYSISSIWYCLFSLLCNIILGTVFSFIYSFIKTKSFDSDNLLKNERKNYLFQIKYFYCK
jgi:hypothetical protein